MLIDFKVENFLSFTTRTSFSMIPTEKEDKLDHIYHKDNSSILRYGAIFGANSSGKSNFLKAISFAKSVIIDNNRIINGKHRFSKTGKGNDKKESVFEFTFLFNNNVYTYGFSALLNEVKFNEEWIYLHDVNDDKEILLFERNIKERKFNIYISHYEEVDLINFQNSIAFNEKALFLTEINMTNVLISKPIFYVFKEIYEWISEKLKIVTFDNNISVYKDFNPKMFNKLLHQFDVGIKELLLTKISEEEFKLKAGTTLSSNVNESILVKTSDNLLCIKRKDNVTEYYNILLRHDKSEYLFEFIDESEGSKRLFEFINLITNKDNESIYIIDEINKSLHPLIIRKFIQLFSKYQKDNQLLFSSHDPSLMDLLRSDEIWLVEREKDDSSRIYSLDTFNVNKSRLNNDYLKGKYGGIPYLREGNDDDD